MEESDAVCDMASSAVCVRKKQEKKKQMGEENMMPFVIWLALLRERGKKKR